MLAGLLGLVILVIRLFPETPVARMLHRGFVEWPLAAALNLERRHLILVAIILCTGHLALALGSVELALAYAVDLSIYADAALGTAIATAIGRLRSAGRAVKASLSAFVGKVRQARPRSRRTPSASARRGKAANDDESGRGDFRRAA